MKLITENDDELVVEYLTSTIAQQIQHNASVVWLVPGGSAMKIAVRVLDELDEFDTSRLCVTLTDERYGEPGHQDENWTQLIDLGFKTQTTNAYRLLRGQDIATTTQEFGDKLSELFSTYDYKIGLFGIGPDGHTAGIKPGTAAATSEDMAAFFSGDDFERITMTPVAIAQLDEVVAYAHGENKFAQLARLFSDAVVPIREQPAQALKLAGKSSVYSDYRK